MPRLSINKSAFVRQLGSMPAKDIVAEAKRRGIKLSIAHVYTIRSAANRKARGGRPARLTARRRPGGPPKNARFGGALHTSITRAAQDFIDAVLAALRATPTLRDMIGV